jgi:hypothetical protein
VRARRIIGGDAFEDFTEIAFPSFEQGWYIVREAVAIDPNGLVHVLFVVESPSQPSQIKTFANQTSIANQLEMEVACGLNNADTKEAPSIGTLTVHVDDIDLTVCPR